MTPECFQEHWTELIEKPLLSRGFKASGKTLYTENNECTLALIRLGGRKSSPGTICHTFCFRHSFLRNLNKEFPKKFEKEVFAYPIKFEPSKISSIGKEGWRYIPTNLNYPTERIDFSKKKENHLIAELKQLQSDLLEACGFLPKILKSEVMEYQIRENGEDAWIERIWLEDYENQRTEQSGAERRR